MEVLNKEKILEHAKRLIDEGKIDKAIVEYYRLLEIDPKDMRVKLRVAELLTRQKKMSDALKTYQEVADNYTDEGFYLKAVTVYKSMLRLNPSLANVNRRLAELYEKMGLVKDATHQYQILANALEQKSDGEGVVYVRRKIVELDPHNVANRMRLAETLQYQGKEEESIEEYIKLVSELKESGRAEQLIDLYEKILSHRSDDKELLTLLCRLYYKRGEWKKVVTALEKAEKSIATDVELLNMLAEVYARLNQLESAKGKYLEVVELYRSAGESEKILDVYRELLVVKPEDEDEIKELVEEIAPGTFAELQAAAEEKRKYLEERQREIEEAPEQEKIETKEKAVAATIGLTDEGAQNLVREADSAGELGKAYLQMGLCAEAKEELARARDLYKAVKLRSKGAPGLAAKIEEIEKLLKGCEATSLPEKFPVEEKVATIKPQPEVKKGPADEKKVAKDGKKAKNRMGFV